MSTDIVKSDFLAPAVGVNDALAAYQAKAEFIRGVLREKVDFDTIPGANKPSLLKPGAEKLTSFFGLATIFEDMMTVEDWTGKEHGGEPFLFYRQKCKLLRGGERLVASADGSCNSWEKKYRYRSQNRHCPSCGKETIIKGKAEYGGGWICFTKKGGCGAKFSDNDAQIIGQEVGVVLNPDVAEVANTILKMAQKRALVAATLIATGVSDYFTQDIEDYQFVDAAFTEPKVAEPDDVDKIFPPQSEAAPASKMPAHVKGMKIAPQDILDQGLAKDIATASWMWNSLCLVNKPLDNGLEICKLYCRWHDTGLKGADAAVKTLAGEQPPAQEEEK